MSHRFLLLLFVIAFATPVSLPAEEPATPQTELLPFRDLIKAYVGPLYTDYEFTQPIQDRMIDEQFIARLKSGRAPARPHWISTFER